MFINQMEKINRLSEINKIGNNTNVENNIDENDSMFIDIFSQSINNYKQSEEDVNKDIYELATGKSDDLHNLMINTKKAEMSLDMLIQLRNKALEAYKTLIGLGI